MRTLRPTEDSVGEVLFSGLIIIRHRHRLSGFPLRGISCLGSNGDHQPEQCPV